MSSEQIHSEIKTENLPGELILSAVAMPSDTNPDGGVFGGWVMAQMDLAGSIPARQMAGMRVVTVSVKELNFVRPIFVGDLVRTYAQIIRCGNTSITVKVEVHASRYRGKEVLNFKVTEAVFTYVAVDEALMPTKLQGKRIVG